MKYQNTAGNEIYKPINNCDCGLTGGCKKCNPYWIGKLSELDNEKKKLNDWKKRFDDDLKRRSKTLFNPKP
uniref:Uncharacterized protein n=1 Tax=viral metagenome TaxID=1070528 RepID=A0A6H1ZJE5_9ZZZZ